MGEPELAADLIAGRATLAQDEIRHAAAPAIRQRLRRGANHVCGMACLKMVLGHRDGEAPPLLELARRSLSLRRLCTRR